MPAETADLFEPAGSLESWADVSECGRYRYQLARKWGSGPIACFVMLNPSTADAHQDDPTIRRCIGFAKREMCGGLVVVNLFAWRATKPSALLSAYNPVGLRNDVEIRDGMRCAQATDGPIIAAWGAHKIAAPRAKEVASWGADLLCLGTTGSGAPRHPLYVPKDAPLIEWRR
jgi:hypothetical protein